MDDMLLQCDKNAIYVLNTSYRYGDLDMINLFGSPAGRALTESTTATAKSSTANMFSQQHNHHYSHNSHAAQSPTMASPASSSASTSTSLFNTANHHGHHHQRPNPSAELAAAAAAQQHEPQPHHLSQHSNHPQPTHPKQIRPTAATLSSLSLSEADTVLRLQQQNDIIKYGAGAVSSDTGTGVAAADKSKKSLIFKSNVIARKAKFWRFLDDNGGGGGGEKSKKSSLEDLSTSSTSGSGSGKSGSLSRWRRGNQKSSSEVYREAAQMLGLSCTLCDSCRCLDCQSRYFDCDDSDTFSENSFNAADLDGAPFTAEQQHYYAATDADCRYDAEDTQLSDDGSVTNPNYDGTAAASLMTTTATPNSSRLTEVVHNATNGAQQPTSDTEQSQSQRQQPMLMQFGSAAANG